MSCLNRLDTRFADMTTLERTVWHRWALSHDWGANRPSRFEENENGEYVLKSFCAVVMVDGSNEIETAYHSTPRELRDWAGY